MKYDFKPRCSICAKYCGYLSDVGIPYGCKYTPDPEPLDEEYFCKKHALEQELKYIEKILENGEGEFRYCKWWQVPSFVWRALKKTNFTMVRNSNNSAYILNNTTMTKQTPSIGDKIILPYDIEDINRIVCEISDDTFTTEIDGVKETFCVDEDYEIIEANNDKLD